MRAPRLLLLLLMALAATACPPDWSSLEFPDAGVEGEGEGEGEGEACAGGASQTGLRSFRPEDLSSIVAMIADSGTSIVVADVDGELHRIDTQSEADQPLATCASTAGFGQLVRTSSGVLVRSGNNSVCALGSDGTPHEVSLVATPTGDIPVGVAVLVDATPATVLVAYPIDPAGTTLQLDRIEVAAAGTLGTPIHDATLTVAYPEAELLRIGAADRVAIAALSGEVSEATFDGTAVVLTSRGRIADSERYGYLAFGPTVGGQTPVVVSINGSDLDVKVRAGIWEQGASEWAPVERDGAFISDLDQSQGLLLSASGRVVHYGDYGYLGVQATPDDVVMPAGLEFRVSDVLRFARGPDRSLWTTTTAGEVARWSSDASFCEASLGTPSERFSTGFAASGVVAPLSATRALIGLNQGVALVDTAEPDPAVRTNDRETREILVAADASEALLVRGDGVAQRYVVSTMSLVASGTPLGVNAATASDLAATRDDIASTDERMVFWVAGLDATSGRALLRCVWEPGSEPSCEEPVAIPAGPVLLDPPTEAFGAVRVLGEDLVVLMASGIAFGSFAAPGDHQVADLTWAPTLPPLNDDADYFTTPPIHADAVAAGQRCALLTGYGPRLLALDLEEGTAQAAHADQRDPFLTALMPLRGDTMLAAGGQGATFYRFAIDPTVCGATTQAEVLGPARPRLQIAAGVEINGAVWLAEDARLWELPLP